MKISVIPVLSISHAWIYLHNPPGSNNRLDEATAVRKNSKRLFKSNNNERGGYNVPDKTSSPATISDDQYKYKYFRSF